MFELQVGDDYMDITTPTGMVMTVRYPDEHDVIHAREIIRTLNDHDEK